MFAILKITTELRGVITRKAYLITKKTAKMNTAALNYTTREINRNFRIKVYGIDGNGKKINTLVGVSGLIALIGIEFVNKFLVKAFGCLEDVFVAKLRRGIKVSFYSK